MQVDFTGTLSESSMKVKDILPKVSAVLRQYGEGSQWEAALDGEDMLEEWKKAEARFEKIKSRLEIVKERSPRRLEMINAILLRASNYAEVMERHCRKFLFEDMFRYMNEIAPEGHYFGAHPEVGADYGFWPNSFNEEVTTYE